MPDIYLKGLHGSIIRSLGRACPPKLVVNLLGDQLHPAAIRRNGQIGGLGIENCPAAHQFLELLLGIRVIQQRPVPRMPGALQLLVDGGR